MTNPNDLVFSDQQGEYLKPAINNAKREAIKSDLEYKSGLTKREWFAGLAMQGLMHPENVRVSANRGGSSYLASVAIDMADALITELSKEVKP